MNDLYKIIDELLHEKGISGAKMSSDLGMSRSFMTELRKGRAKSIKTETAKKIADYLGVSTDFLLGKVSAISDNDHVQMAQHSLQSYLSDNPECSSGERLSILFEASGFNPTVVCFNLGIDRSILDSWIELAELPPRPIVDKFLGVFHIQPSQLLNGAEIQEYENGAYEWGISALSQNTKTPALTEKDRRDIAKDLEAMMAQLDGGGDMMFDGDPISDEARASIRNALQMGLEIAKVKNKERFTPKKYRKD